MEILIIDDGSTDRSVEVARGFGVDHIVSLGRNQGLAKAFMTGLEACLKAGADIIVNTDADNQYCADDIPKLIRPILDGHAEMVVGARPIRDIKHFSPVKKLLQKFGSWVVRQASRTDVPDSPSGFRAISRAAALQLNVFSEYTYTLETIIQAGLKNIPVRSVPVRVNEELRPSRLMKSTASYIWRSMTTIVRILMLYRPVKFFFALSIPPLLVGAALVTRWLILYFLVDPTRVRAPSLIAATILVVLGGLGITVGLLADLLAANRKLMEETQLRLRRLELSASVPEKKNP